MNYFALKISLIHELVSIVVVLLLAINPANIAIRINSIPILNDSNFKSWKNNLLIVLGVINLDLALKTNSPPLFYKWKYLWWKERYGKIREIKLYVYDDNEESHSRNIQGHNV